MSDHHAEADCVSFSEQTSTCWLDAMLAQLAALLRHRVKELEKAIEVSPLAEALRDFPTARLGACLDLPDMTLLEALATAVTLAPELQPHVFDEAISNALQSAGNHPRIGGMRTLPDAPALRTDIVDYINASYGLGTLNANLPTYAVLTAPHKDGQYSKELERVVVGSRGGSLGPTYDPFNPAGGAALSNMKLNLPANRLYVIRESQGIVDSGKFGQSA